LPKIIDETRKWNIAWNQGHILLPENKKGDDTCNEIKDLIITLNE